MAPPRSILSRPGAPLEVVEVVVRVGDVAKSHGEKNDDLPIENGDLPIENGDLPIENRDLPIDSMVIFHSYNWYNNWLVVWDMNFIKPCNSWDDDPIWRNHFFQRGWNHQPENMIYQETWGNVPSGNLTLANGPVEIVDLPMNNGDFP